MLKLNLTLAALAFLDNLPAKQYKQIVNAMLGLLKNPTPQDSSMLKGYPYRRIDRGEYRLVRAVPIIHMKIQILSDLHLEFENFSIDTGRSDVVVLAGDIHLGDKGVRWAIEAIPNKPVLYVLGNHEYYGNAYPKLTNALKALCLGTNVHILENDTLSLDGVNFIGCTLWTDFELFGNARLTGYQCQQIMSDYKKIRLSPKFSKLRSIDVAVIHRKSKLRLIDELQKHAGETNIVITHHGPSPQSLPNQAIVETADAAYVSALEPLIEQYRPSYWLHGHIHKNSDYKIGTCRVICNPKGYPGEQNPDFDPHFTIEI
ncbi:MAG: metallophosphoesterase [Gammaproteobacteria bacterium]